MKTIIESLDEIRDVSPVTPSDEIRTQLLKLRLSESRAEILKSVEDYMRDGGATFPVENILGIFTDYLQVCGHLENIAADLECEEKTKDRAEEIRGEYLPPFEYLSRRFYAVKSILTFVTEIAENERIARDMENELSNMKYKGA